MRTDVNLRCRVAVLYVYRMQCTIDYRRRVSNCAEVVAWLRGNRHNHNLLIKNIGNYNTANLPFKYTHMYVNYLNI
jgi:hypothetical protein